MSDAQRASLADLAAWVGRTETRADWVTVPVAERLSATLDRNDPPPRIGDRLPIGWHGTLFPRIAPRSEVGRDGHPKLGDFLPPVPLPRRMFAGRRITFHNDMRVGDEVKREARIKDVVIKEGRNGQMVFVTLVVDLSTERGPVLTEEHDVVYREIGRAHV